MTEQGESTPERVLAKVPFEQNLDWELFGFQPKPDRDVGRAARRPSGGGYCSSRYDRPRGVSREYKKMYDEWWKEWSEKRGWKKQVAMVGELEGWHRDGDDAGVADE